MSTTPTTSATNATPPHDAPSGRLGRLTRRRLGLIALVGAVLGTLVALAAGVGAPRPVGDHGDAALAARVRAQIADDRGFASLSVAEVTPERVTWAGLGEASPGVPPTSGTPYPLGSITKTFNGMLLADAVRRGEVRLDQRVDTLLPGLRGSEAGGVTLEELASHRSGLPRLLPSEMAWGAASAFSLGNPYRLSREQLVEGAARTALSGRGTVAYSNLGASLLGHALAEAADAPDWETLARDRLWTPLGMTSTREASVPQDIPAGTAVERTASGGHPTPWTTEGQAPMGASVWTTADDLARYAQGVLTGQAPGMAALEPHWDASGRARVRLHWFTSEVDGRTFAWHNGGTSGGRTMLVVDRDARRAYLVLGSSTREVDDIAMGLATNGRVESRPELPIVGLVVLGLALLTGIGAFRQAGRPATRAQRAETLLSGTAFAILLVRVGPWTLLPGWLAGALVGAMIPALVVAGLGLVAGPHRTEGPVRTVLGWLGALVGAALLAVAASGVI